MLPPPCELQDIKNISLSELSEYLKNSGSKSFHAKQILSWVFQRGVSSFDEMTDLPISLRQQLIKDFSLGSLIQKEVLSSRDGTKKFLFSVGPNEYIETVLIPARGRTTLCVSSQVGCKFACIFCASGLQGFSRHLSSAEILDQILCVNRHLKGQTITHIVFMGVGEPMDNYDNVFKAIRMINASYGLNIAARRITVSTCGLIPQIERMATEGLQIELAVSLHSVDEDTRTRLMPINKKYPVGALLKVCRVYAQTTNRQVTFEYILMRGVNDAVKDALDLAQQLKGMLCKVNLIACHAVSSQGFLAPEPSQISKFKEVLFKKGIVVTVRLSRGEDVQAACGQLRYVRSQEPTS
jgi:23S rRNA (adenine2503-C2)-methyltransferase